MLSASVFEVFFNLISITGEFLGGVTKERIEIVDDFVNAVLKKVNTFQIDRMIFRFYVILNGL